MKIMVGIAAGVFGTALLVLGAFVMARRQDSGEGVFRQPQPVVAGPSGRNGATEGKQGAAELAALRGKIEGLERDLRRLEEEKRMLQARNASLDKAAAEAKAAGAGGSGEGATTAGEGGDAGAKRTTPEAPPTPESVAAGFEKLAELGLAAYGTEPLMDLVKQVKTLGKAGLDLMAERLAKDERAGARFLVAAILEALADPAAVPALEKALKEDADSLVRRMASHAMAVMHPPEALPGLEAAMRGDADWGVKVNAAYGLAKAGRSEGVQEMLKAYRDPNVDAGVKPAVLGGLADVADPSTAELFREVLHSHREIGFEFMAIKALEKMKDTASLQDLEWVINNSPSHSVKEAAKAAFNTISGKQVYPGEKK